MTVSIRLQTPHVVHGPTTSLCDECFLLVPAKILIEAGSVFHQHRCRSHGVRSVLVSTTRPPGGCATTTPSLATGRSPRSSG